MVDHFPDEVQSIVGPVLSNLGFTLDSVDEHVDEGGRFGSVAYYKAADCRVQIYQSSREGATNCMIAPLDAPNEFGPRDTSCRWQYLTRFAPRRDESLEELVEAVSFEPKTTTEELRWVRDNIQKYSAAARAGIREMYGSP